MFHMIILSFSHPSVLTILSILDLALGLDYVEHFLEHIKSTHGKLFLLGWYFGFLGFPYERYWDS